MLQIGRRARVLLGAAASATIAWLAARPVLITPASVFLVLAFSAAVGLLYEGCIPPQTHRRVGLASTGNVSHDRRAPGQAGKG
jgi:hypothetical protein